ncbi:MAG TPA: hypothetical protein VF178_08605 [Gemmatimonadaceae bacterium]
MDADTLRPIVVGLFAGVVTTAVVARSARHRPEEAEGRRVILRYGRGLQIFACASLLVWTAFAVRNALYGSAVNSYLVAVSVPSLLAVGSAYLAVGTIGTTVILDDHGIISRSPWRRTRTVRWEDVTEAWYGEVNSTWMLRTRRDGTIRIAAMMLGSDVVPKYLNQHRIPLRGC